ncbi:hypothetical protein [uncultured Negativibacillus sp.]|uniref:hypothetical protein n=1 Tax=uncultured Negativibacillus sp. TaxID=1980696 RepID=UPI0025E2279E|nr:hypothetical protein [uncultured Negativibacillus sp.]
MLDKKQIIARLEELHLDDTKYWLITGGAMVLYGLREQTSDIDLGCTSDLADLLQQEGFPVERMPDGTRKIVVAEDVEIFENWLEDKVERFEGVPVISIQGLIEMKRALGREKDFRDIQLILEKYPEYK